ncbi:hypothetical protein B0J14DRAFT_632040 [Halenospora varia]|nr:hypothetical protein B0J14DRAFT_632040 [Halenospora varia]
MARVEKPIEPLFHRNLWHSLVVGFFAVLKFCIIWGLRIPERREFETCDGVAGGDVKSNLKQGTTAPSNKPATSNVALDSQSSVILENFMKSREEVDLGRASKDAVQPNKAIRETGKHYRELEAITGVDFKSLHNRTFAFLASDNSEPPADTLLREVWLWGTAFDPPRYLDVCDEEKCSHRGKFKDCDWDSLLQVRRDLFTDEVHFLRLLLDVYLPRSVQGHFSSPRMPLVDFHQSSRSSSQPQITALTMRVWKTRQCPLPCFWKASLVARNRGIFYNQYAASEHQLVMKLPKKATKKAQEPAENKGGPKLGSKGVQPEEMTSAKAGNHDQEYYMVQNVSIDGSSCDPSDLARRLEEFDYCTNEQLGDGSNNEGGRSLSNDSPSEVISTAGEQQMEASDEAESVEEAISDMISDFLERPGLHLDWI